MLHTFRNDIEVAWPDTHVAITEFDCQVALQNSAYVSGSRMGGQQT